MSKFIGIFCFLFVLMGCPSAKYEDISSNKEYVQLIGSQFKTHINLKVHGISKDRNHKKVIDYFLLTESPGIAGPEVVSYSDLPAGALIEVKKVTLCTNCPFASEDYIVAILSNKKYKNANVTLSDIGDKSIAELKDGQMVFNADLFELVDDG